MRLLYVTWWASCFVQIRMFFLSWIWLKHQPSFRGDALPSQEASQTMARASGRLFHSWTWRASAALGSVSVRTITVHFITTSFIHCNTSHKHTGREKLTVDIIGSMMAATSICLASSRGMPISKAAAARRRTLEAECTTRGTTSFAQRTAPSHIGVGTCSSSLETRRAERLRRAGQSWKQEVTRKQRWTVTEHSYSSTVLEGFLNVSTWFIFWGPYDFHSTIFLVVIFLFVVVHWTKWTPPTSPGLVNGNVLLLQHFTMDGK